MSDNRMMISEKWKDKETAIRNLDIAKMVAGGTTEREAAKYFGLSHIRINQIYRGVMACIFHDKKQVPYLHAVYSKAYYRHPEALSMVLEYEKEYLDYIN